MPGLLALLGENHDAWSLLMLQAFVDDSGSHTDSPVFVLAGLLAPAIRWGQLEKQWIAALSKYEIDYFKASEAESLQGEFRGRSETERDRCVDEFLEMAVSASTFGCSIAVREDEFRQAFAGFPRKHFERPYAFLFVMMLAKLQTLGIIAGRLVDKHLEGMSGNIWCFFDKQKGDSHAKEVWTGAPELFDLVSAVTHVSSRDFKPLQAADLFAWSVRRRLLYPHVPPSRIFEKFAKKSWPPDVQNVEALRGFAKSLQEDDLSGLDALKQFRVACVRWALEARLNSSSPKLVEGGD